MTRLRRGNNRSLVCAIAMYNFEMRKAKEIHFSHARQNLSAIVDEVARTGRPVTLLRHGKPAVIISSLEDYESKTRNAKRGHWLAGSIRIKEGVDLDKALAELSKRHAKMREESLRRSAEEFLREP
jgi:prevent-host-death family protein